MALTEMEKFLFDLNGFLVRPSILTPDEVAAVTEQVRLLGTDQHALPPEHRAVPAGPSEFLIDHPKIIEVIHELIGPDVRLEGSFHVYRQKGIGEQVLHQGSGKGQADPIFGYRVENGRIFAGAVRVVIELTDVEEADGTTAFVPGSHKSNFALTDGYGTGDDGPLASQVRSYSCPAGSAVFFTENLLHGGRAWRRDTPRVAILSLYNHVAINFTRWRVPVEVLRGLSHERLGYYRPVWHADFSDPTGTRVNTLEDWVEHREGVPVTSPEAADWVAAAV